MVNNMWVFGTPKSDVTYINCFMSMLANYLCQGSRKISVDKKAHYYTVGVGNGWKYSASISSVA